MGFNSVLFLCNDAIGQIEKDPEGWWKEAWAHLNDSECQRGWTSTFGFGNHANGFQAVWNRHADETAIIVVGQNMAEVVYRHYGNGMHHTAEGQVELCRQWAADLGYELKKRHPDRIEKRLADVEREHARFPEGHIGEAGARRRFLGTLIEHLKKLLGRS